jgi:hypothetical protein
MLTPGEFVVNRASTQKHLPLLRAINNGVANYSKGGVVYLEEGDEVPNNGGSWIDARRQIAQQQPQRQDQQNNNPNPFGNLTQGIINLTQGIINLTNSLNNTSRSYQTQAGAQTGTAPYLTKLINNPAVPGQNPGLGAQPAQNNNIWITLNNDISRFNSALNIAASALGQFNQQLAAGITQNSVSNNGNPGNVNFNAVSQFTSTFQSFIDQLRDINPVINMTGTHTVVVQFNGAGVFAGMEDKVKQFVVSQINQSMDQLSRGTEGAIPTYQV